MAFENTDSSSDVLHHGRVLPPYVHRINYTLVFDGNSNAGLNAYCDSSYGDDRTELDRKRRSTQGYFFSLVNAAIQKHRL